MNELVISDSMPEWDYASITLETFDSNEWLEYLADVFINQGQTACNRSLEKFSRAGNKVGFRSAKKYWKDYLEEFASNTRNVGSELETEFSNQPIKLRSGRWTCDDSGVRSFDFRFGELFACRHPIIPIERIINVDTGQETIRLGFKRPDMRSWSSDIVVAKSVLASPQKIIELSDRGISVTSENAKPLISFLQEIEGENYDRIPLRRSTARLGWINETEFSPYTPGLDFDASSALGRQYQSVRESGDFDEWKKLIVSLRNKDVVYKILTAASFASVILHIVDALPSFVHLWSSMSSTGKTIGLMAAASVWGDPAPGAYVQSYNATVVAMERLAEFYNSMPLVLDELQQARDNRGQSGVNVYKLAQGSGKSRSNKSGGLEKLPTWANFILSSGESPLVDQSDGAGALARVINMELDHALVTGDEGNDIARTLKANHGQAGRMLVEAILDGTVTRETIIETYSANLTALLKDSDVQDKQAMSAAAIITGDMIASMVVTGDTPLSMAELKPYLLTKSQTDITDRAYEFITEWVVSNGSKFIGIAPPIDLPSPLYGSIESGYAYIISSVFRNAMKDEGFNPDSSLSAFRKAGLIKTESDKSRFTYRKRIGASRPHTVAIKLPDDDDLPELPSF